MKISKNWLQDYVSFREPVEELADSLTMAGLEVKGTETLSSLKDEVMEIEITSNRPDWLSHVGVAREVAALTGKKLSYPKWENKIPRVGKRDAAIEIRDIKLCPYYSACLLEGVEFGESPDFIKARLQAVGMRPINLVVDVTNYVLLEMGQPLHAFDWDRLVKGKIIVRRALDKEKIVAIDGTDYVLDNQDLLIADSKHPIAIAGVMGGIESEVGPKTRNILLESAYFSPVSVRKTSKKLGLVSESSYRFERGVDPRGVDIGRERAIHLIRGYAKNVGRISEIYQAGKPPVKEPTIVFPLSEIPRILGLDLPMTKVTTYLRSLGLEVRAKKKGVISVKAPSFREDLSRPVDLVEEIARLHGYGHIPESIPFLKPVYPGERVSLKVEESLRDILLGAGVNEVVTFSLVNEKIFEKLGVTLSDATRIINPQNKELTLMRPTLFPSLLEVVKTNFYHGSGTEVRIFEIAGVYGPETKKNLPKEETTLGLAVSGVKKPHWLEKGRKHSLFDLKGILEEVFFQMGVSEPNFLETENPFLSEAFSISANGRSLGVLGKVSMEVQEYYDIASDVFLAEISLEKFSDHVSFDRRFKSLPKYPASERDIALVLKEDVRVKEIIELILSVNRQFIKNARVIDLYRGGQIPAGKKSVAFSIEYRADDHTLTTDEILALHAKVVQSVLSRFGAELRA